MLRSHTTDLSLLKIEHNDGKSYYGSTQGSQATDQ